MPWDRTMFDTFESKIPAIQGRPKPLPPLGVRVITQSSLSKIPLEAVLMHRKCWGNKPRWRIFGYKGMTYAYPFRGWQPASWTFKDEM